MDNASKMARLDFDFLVNIKTNKVTCMALEDEQSDFVRHFEDEDLTLRSSN